jgi:cytochrome bd-type quinol oxidase subunit 1
MSLNRRLSVLAAALLVALLFPSVASAQQARLKWPTIAAGAAATADWATTYHALKFYKVQEQNPVLRPFQSTPGRLVSMGGMIDVAGISAWNLTVGRKHEKMAVAGLWTMTAFRAYLAIHNHVNEHRSERR